MNLAAIQALNKMTFCLEAIKSFSASNNPANMGLINVVASEVLAELEPEIAAMKSSEMDKYQPGDLVTGY